MTNCQRPKAIAVDLDGTLLDSRKQVSQANREAIRRCQEAGIPVFPATARPIRSSRILLKDSEICPGPGVFLGGARAVAPDGSVCVDKSIPSEKLPDILATIERHAPGAWITVETSTDDWFSTRPMSEAILAELHPEIVKTYGPPPTIVGLEGLAKQRAAKVIVSWDGKSLGKTCEELTERFNSSLSYVWTTGEDWLEVLPENTAKETALDVLLGCSGISIDDCAAFGDGSNDITFLAGCGISVAMANAMPKCLEVAQFITKSNDEDGFAWAVKELFGI